MVQLTKAALQIQPGAIKGQITTQWKEDTLELESLKPEPNCRKPEAENYLDDRDSTHFMADSHSSICVLKWSPTFNIPCSSMKCSQEAKRYEALMSYGARMDNGTSFFLVSLRYDPCSHAVHASNWIWEHVNVFSAALPASCKVAAFICSAFAGSKHAWNFV